MINIAIIDAHPVVLEGLVAWSKRHNDFSVVASSSKANDIVNIAENSKPDLFIIEIIGQDDIMDRIRLLYSVNKQINTIIFTSSEDTADAVRSLDAGAKSYLLKTEGLDVLETAIYASLRGESYISGRLSHKVITALQQKINYSTSLAAANMTTRERHVLRFLVCGKTNAEIAGELEIAESTVKGHMNKIMEKLNVRNRLEAAIMAQKLDLVK